MSSQVRRQIVLGALLLALALGSLPGLANAAPGSPSKTVPSFIVSCTNSVVNDVPVSVVRAVWQGNMTSLVGEFTPVSGAPYSEMVQVSFLTSYEWVEAPLASAVVKFRDRKTNVVQSRSASCS